MVKVYFSEKLVDSFFNYRKFWLGLAHQKAGSGAQQLKLYSYVLKIYSKYTRNVLKIYLNMLKL